MDKLVRKNLFSKIIARDAKEASPINASLHAHGKGCILAVDDSRTQLYALKKVLTEAGYEVLTAASGENGIKLANRMLPDLILMDIVMPGINGFEATRALSASDVTAHIPVIIISGSDQASDRVWGKRAGASDFMAKPIGRQQLLEKVAYFRRKQVLDSLDRDSALIHELFTD